MSPLPGIPPLDITMAIPINKASYSASLFVVVKSNLTDLVTEFTEHPMKELESTENIDEKLVGTIFQHGLPAWEVYVDGALNQKGSGIGLVLISPEKVIIEKSLRLDF